ncbi:MAG: amino acid ABC transporter substrate-binding protein [Clostridia bacterium]|nr:amino acid ABC transporter substrate-binding protein [Clostridia bacterium]
MKKIMLAVLLLAFVFSTGACSSSSIDMLVVGVTDDYPPMGYRNTEGDLTGFEVDLAKAIASEMGVELEFVVLHREDMMSSLKNRSVDLLISSVSMTKDKTGYLDFTDPYLENGHVILTKTDLVDTITSVETLAGLTVGVESESTADALVTSQKGMQDFTLIRYETMSVLIAALKAGQLDCILCDMSVAIDIVDKYPKDFAVSSAHLTNEPLAIAMNPGNDKLKKELNDALEKLSEDGTLSELSEEYLGADYTQDIDTNIS